jgi:transposase InsO family protein
LGFWTSYSPFAVPQRWPFYWWVATVVDHFSRRILGVALYRQQPTSRAIRTFLARVMSEGKCRPRHFISDQGGQFIDEAFRKWLRGLGIRQRFGAVGKHGSIAVIERLIQTIKRECTRRVIVPFLAQVVRRELALFSTWYNHERPHEGLLAATPDEIYRGVSPACLKPRFEPRAKWPAHSPCAAPHSRVRGRPGVRLDLHVSYLAGRKHLPIVSLKPAA